MKIFKIALIAFALATPSIAQVGRGGAGPIGGSKNGLVIVAVDPSGSCAASAPLRYNSVNGKLWGCQAGTWTQVSGGSGGGLPTGNAGVPSFDGVSAWTNVQFPAVGSSSNLQLAGYTAGGGTAQAQTVMLSKCPAALATGLWVFWKPTAANTATAPTLAVCNFTAKPITKVGATALVANDLTTAAVAWAIYDGTQYQLQNPQAGSGGVDSLELNIGGIQNGGAVVSWNCTHADQGVNVDTVYCRMTPTSPQYMERQITWPAKWNSGSVTVVFSLGTQGADTGNMKVLADFACVNISNTFGTASSVTFANSAGLGSTPQTFVITGIDSAGCAPRQYGVLRLTRDNTVGSNSTDTFYIQAAGLEYTSK